LPNGGAADQLKPVALPYTKPWVLAADNDRDFELSPDGLRRYRVKPIRSSADRPATWPGSLTGRCRNDFIEVGADLSTLTGAGRGRPATCVRTA
jgi:hypothetical protein